MDLGEAGQEDSNTEWCKAPDVVNFRGEARISAGGKHKFPNPYYA